MRSLNKYGSTDNEADAAVGQIVKDFHDLDKAGVAFRYGWGKNRKEIKLPDGPIDLANIRDVMEGVADYFNGLGRLVIRPEFCRALRRPVRLERWSRSVPKRAADALDASASSVGEGMMTSRRKGEMGRKHIDREYPH